MKLFAAGGVLGMATVTLTRKTGSGRKVETAPGADNHSHESIEALAEEIFELSTLSSVVRSRSKTAAGGDQLTESEFLTLDSLAKESPQTVGAIQKAIGVLPAQMSRIIRSLEEKAGTAYILCKINAEDRRRIDVHLTPDGRKAHDAYRRVRLGFTTQVLSEMGPADRQEFMRLLRLMRGVIRNHLSDKYLSLVMAGMSGFTFFC
jgi:DNA-binding MarR family transcriptional regulator